jgi:hypothetical protein
VRKLAPHLSVSHAATAGTAQRAETAGNADSLGGQPAASYEPRSQWALVNKDGQILAQSGGITIDAGHASSGQYVLGFGSSVANRPVSVVSHYADPGLSGEASAAPCGNTAAPGGVECAFFSPQDETPSHLFVEMHNSAGTDAPFDFYVIVGH